MKQQLQELKAKEILDYCILNLTGDYELKDDEEKELYYDYMLQEIKNLLDYPIF